MEVPIAEDDLGVSTHALDLESGRMAKYKEVFEHILPQVDEEARNPRRADPTHIYNVTGEYNGTKYRLYPPHVRRGKHAFVAFVDLNAADGETASAVLRDNRKDAEEYLKVGSTHPVAKELMPELYGIVGPYVVMERLHGLELEELGDRLLEDPDFRRQYARQAIDVMIASAQDGLKLSDVVFGIGHNVMVDPETSECRLVEQRTLTPTTFPTNEVITEQLFDEFRHIAHSGEEWQIRFGMELLIAVKERLREEDLVIPRREIRPANSNYRDIYLTQEDEEISDEAYTHILNDPVLREELTLPWFDREHPKTINTKLFDAARQGDLEEASKIIKERLYIESITDKNDPRYATVILPDDFS